MEEKAASEPPPRWRSAAPAILALEAVRTERLTAILPLTTSHVTTRPILHENSSDALMQMRILADARNKGLRRSARLGFNILRTQAKTRTRKTGRQFLFISHPIDNTGAPQVLIHAVEEFARKYGGRNVHLVAPSIAPDQLERLESSGIRIDKAAEMGLRLVKLQLALRKGDFVLMNTVAVYETYQRLILRSLRTGQLGHAFWFIHEDRAQLPSVAPFLLDTAFQRQLGQLIEKNRLTVLVPSKRFKADYDELLDTNKVRVIPLRVDIDRKYRRLRPASDYEKINFMLSGTPTDGRKGQLIAIFAFQELLQTYLDNHQANYRDFTLTVIGIADDYLSQQIRTIGTAVLGERLKIYPKVSHEEALEVTSGCNAVICCSLNEGFPLYIAEAMVMGHVLLRNNTGGREEQLKEGVNGYYINSDDIDHVAHVLEEVLNPAKISESELQAMGRASQEIIAPFEGHSYIEHLEAQ